LVGKPEGNSPLRRPKDRWEYNIKMDRRWDDKVVDWIPPTRERDNWPAPVNAIIKFRFM
jgi:hypothetical protein